MRSVGIPPMMLKEPLQSPSSGKEERSRIRKTFWSYLFRNVNRCVWPPHRDHLWWSFSVTIFTKCGPRI